MDYLRIVYPYMVLFFVELRCQTQLFFVAKETSFPLQQNAPRGCACRARGSLAAEAAARQRENAPRHILCSLCEETGGNLWKQESQ